MKIYDITHPMTNGIASWPDDTPYEFRLAWKMSDGASVNVGSITTSVHTGTHADAPFHFLRAGKTIDQLPLLPFIGPAIVIDVAGRDRISSEELRKHDFRGAPRVLLKTGAWPDVSKFPERIPVLAPGAATYLKSQGVMLIGLDVPSVDALDSKDLPIHHEIGGCGICILESLNLQEVAPGRYELIALPLRLAGADGAPVRAILRQVG